MNTHPSSSAIVKADSYVASFAQGNSRICPVGSRHANISEDQNGRDPSFVGAAGKSFRVKLTPICSKPANTPNCTGLFDEVKGLPLRLNCKRPTKWSPFTCDREYRYSRRCAGNCGCDWRLLETANLTFNGTQSSTSKFFLKPAQIHFDSNWQANTIGEIRAGDSLDLAYDMSRLRQILGEDITDASHVSIR